jgi:hypothetical protein
MTPAPACCHLPWKAARRRTPVPVLRFAGAQGVADYQLASSPFETFYGIQRASRTTR